MAGTAARGPYHEAPHRPPRKPSPLTDTPDSPAPARPPNYSARRAVLVAVLLVLGLGAVYLGMVAFRSDTLPAGTTALGVPLGGLTRDEAVVALQQQTEDLAGEPIDVRVRKVRLSVDPQDVALRLDAAATVDSAVVSRWNPLALLGGPPRTLTPVVTADEAALDETVSEIAADTDEPAREPAIAYDGLDAELTRGRAGSVLDQPAAAAALVAGFLREETVTLPVVEDAPSVSEQTAQNALAAARAAVAEPVSVVATTSQGAATARLEPEVLAEALTYTAGDGAMVPVLDGAVLRAAIADDVASVEVPGRDATWKIRKGEPVVVPSKVGRGVDADELASKVAGVLAATGAARTVEAGIGSIEPRLTTAQAEALGVTERLSTFTQGFPYAAYRSQNIGQAAKYVNGTLLRPGETFSMNDTIKERTVANGYTEGFIVGPGGVFQEDLGGGVSTATTAVWTAAFFAGMERVHTQAHSIWISRYQAGLEATVAWGFFDMQFRNDTRNGVFITTRMTPTSITVSFWGTKVYDQIRDRSGPRTGTVAYKTVYDPSPTCHAQSGVAGFTIVVTREFLTDGEVVRSEPITTRYRPSPQVLCKKDPAKKPDKKPRKPADEPTPSGSPSATPSPAATKPNNG